VNGADQAAVTLADSACNTVPTGTAISWAGAHPGRIFVSWIASDPESPLTGCNVTMLQSFHTLFVAWSDGGGRSWTPLAPHDEIEPTDANRQVPTGRLCRPGQRQDVVRSAAVQLEPVRRPVVEPHVAHGDRDLDDGAR
jgi:hypothetical protein